MCNWNDEGSRESVIWRGFRSLALVSFQSTGVRQVKLNIYNTINLMKKVNRMLSIYSISIYVFCYTRQGNIKLHWKQIATKIKLLNGNILKNIQWLTSLCFKIPLKSEG